MTTELENDINDLGDALQAREDTITSLKAVLVVLAVSLGVAVTALVITITLAVTK